jgi:hypothetical protein
MSNILTKQFFVPRLLMCFICLLLLVIIVGMFFPSPVRSKTKVKIIATRGQIKSLAFSLNEYNKSNGHLPLGDNSNIATILSAVFTNGFLNYPDWTNSNGELVDCWRMPFQIQIADTTNFIICSAGPNKIFGNTDDIIFNSVSNDFVKP